MEGIRQKATAKAKAVKEEKANRLKAYFSELPETMTKEQAFTLIGDEYCRQRKVTEQAFWQQVRLHKLMAYSLEQNAWLNLCRNNPLTSAD